jgi:hypothetical protein
MVFVDWQPVRLLFAAGRVRLNVEVERPVGIGDEFIAISKARTGASRP